MDSDHRYPSTATQGAPAQVYPFMRTLQAEKYEKKSYCSHNQKGGNYEFSSA